MSDLGTATGGVANVDQGVCDTMVSFFKEKLRISDYRRP